MHVSMPYGPHKITKVRQVAIPAELLHAVGLEVGDFIHYRLSDHDPYVIEMIPSDVLERRYRAGADSEALERLNQPSPPDDMLPDKSERDSGPK